ncbi:uroporphyrinogen-III C-methyltransferase [Thalassotalea sp. M1531]|uniref:uroporphyrinogen-III C-methyltransferase n=1 Tax=Thalassotalea algicola TaxID=2716224 RepID=A0A7Y0Q7Z8_9GAMM|nr:uroporphyrinogen-III C-methyltransferase [Thalassotalea algicola]NMP32447.1 uroporphyrinogen-III C-methyltransferase [Thalassotalea algicola]
MFSVLKLPFLQFKKPLSQSFRWQSKLPTKTKGKGQQQGQVIFVGAGAGDSELLTVKAVNALKQADVVLIDWLVNPEINQLIPGHIERIFVGKKCGQHSMKQADINKLLLKKARENKTVVRLKGGDPSIFARLPEETGILAHNNIPFQIVPGVTAASGCAAYTGIPLTHRDCSQSVKFVTAHLKNEDSQCDWQHLASDKGTLVFYMGLSRVDTIASQLIKFGMNETTPIAVIDQGTSEQQQLCRKTLATINAGQDLKNFKGPALIIVGEVVDMRVLVDLTLTTKQDLLGANLTYKSN